MTKWFWHLQVRCGGWEATAMRMDSDWLTLLSACLPAEVEKTRCQLEREHILGAARQSDSQRPLPPGLFVPECDEHGQYMPTQCHGSTGYCWCVDRDGREVEGTRTRPGTRPPCKSEQSPLVGPGWSFSSGSECCMYEALL